ncbi:hypothetical protein EJ08DRAFT_74253 [Tothia fuscella]|uniref:Uncharacterized protein n=1 Tax=Tothia fuscella TaxID=1048955 RepID=A0A9P4NXS4_9PEZI|nr:hypothetical protein EJ08DRAFT_74253 [Tothia fuscella]
MEQPFYNILILCTFVPLAPHFAFLFMLKHQDSVTYIVGFVDIACAISYFVSATSALILMVGIMWCSWFHDDEPYEALNALGFEEDDWHKKTVQKDSSDPIAFRRKQTEYIQGHCITGPSAELPGVSSRSNTTTCEIMSTDARHVLAGTSLAYLSALFTPKASAASSSTNLAHENAPPTVPTRRPSSPGRVRPITYPNMASEGEKKEWMGELSKLLVSSKLVKK